MCHLNDTEGGDDMPSMTIAEARKLKGVSQKKMAILIGCSYTAYRGKEKYRTLMNANEIADFLIFTGLDYKDIIFGYSNRVI